jgi:predicted metal-dependent phosphoesterase TrpH
MDREQLHLKIDLHVHSCYSLDSVISPDDLVWYARQRGLDGVAVTDHDRLDGALKIASETDFLVIPGMEISSLEGHIIGLNINKQIPNKLTVHETVERIHNASGFAVACHPIGLFKEGLGRHVESSFDAVEVINSSAIPFSYAVTQSRKIAARLQKPCVAGSDAHFGPEIGCAFTIIDAAPNANDIVRAIGNGLSQPFGNAIPLSLRLKRIVEINRRKLKL